MSDMKEKILKEVGYSLSLKSEKTVGFIAIVLSEDVKSKVIRTTVIDIAHSGLGKVDSPEARETFAKLGQLLADNLLK